MQKNVKKRGFNLIEIAIVLAVIGLVIGGIYVAASSVTENQRKQKAQSQLLTLVQNFRAAYANQSWTSSSAPTNKELYYSHVIPADIIPDDTTSPNTFTGAFGTVAIGNGGATDFTVTLNSVPQSACIDLIAKNFGTAAQVSQIGLTSIKAGATGATAVTAPYSVTNATTACVAGTNVLVFQLAVHS